MKNIIYPILALLLISCGATKIEILGRNITQKDFCPELGDGKICNPFPYGTPTILQNTRWAFPRSDKNGDSLSIETIAKTYIGGLFVNDVLPSEADDDIQNEYFKRNYIDIHTGSTKIKVKDSLVENFSIDISVQNIVNAIAASKINTITDLLNSHQQTVENELKQKFENIKKEGVTLNLIYHSVKLNGTWFKDFLNNDPLASRVKDSDSLKIKIDLNPILKDSKKEKLSYIGGLGIIQYDGSHLKGIERELDLSVPKALNEYIQSEYKKEIMRNFIKSVPYKFDLVLVSTLGTNK